jgi:hypothetical protein
MRLVSRDCGEGAALLIYFELRDGGNTMSQPNNGFLLSLIDGFEPIPKICIPSAPGYERAT